MYRYHATATNIDDDFIDIGLFKSRKEAKARFKGTETIHAERWKLSIKKVPVLKKVSIVREVYVKAHQSKGYMAQAREDMYEIFWR